jgi:predicted unusual protein kinase regulating ubiquinone biosynthesis (AarF/ABC1/UbiB family)
VNITVTCKQQDGKEMILAIQRPRVRNRISAGFTTLQKLSRTLATEAKMSRDLGKHIGNIAQKAKKIANDEIDINLTAHQFECAEERYHDFEITVDGQTYTFKTPFLQYY